MPILFLYHLFREMTLKIEFTNIIVNLTDAIVKKTPVTITFPKGERNLIIYEKSIITNTFEVITSSVYYAHEVTSSINVYSQQPIPITYQHDVIHNTTKEMLVVSFLHVHGYQSSL